jgi:hypothetical protein
LLSSSRRDSRGRGGGFFGSQVPCRVFLPSGPSLGTCDFAAKLNSWIFNPNPPGWETGEETGIPMEEVFSFHILSPLPKTLERLKRKGEAGGGGRCWGRRCRQLGRKVADGRVAAVAVRPRGATSG